MHVLNCTRPGAMYFAVAVIAVSIIELIVIILSNDNLVSFDDCFATVSYNLVNFHAFSLKQKSYYSEMTRTFCTTFPNLDGSKATR